MATNDPTIVLIRGRLQAPHLYEPFTDKYGKTRYQAILRVYDEAEQAKLMKAIEAAVRAKCPNDWQKKLRQVLANPNCCLLRTPDDTDEYKFLKVTRRPEDGAPMLIDRARRNVPQSAGLFVSGAHVICRLQLWFYSNQSTGVGATITGAQWVAEGDAFGGAPLAKEDDFADLSADDSPVNDDAFL